ncbi:MAG: hypothetical protein JNK82_07800 [Myxococcaceae bacterium]|nr:hypothetical protein [Myxococcaceae bacterium]
MHSVLSGPATPITLNEAGDALKAVASLADGLSPRQLQWLREMQNALAKMP